MKHIARIAVIAATGLACAGLAACGHDRPRAQVDLMDRSRDIFLLLRYDANNDHLISRVEMDAGLKSDYARADLNHDGKLTPDEVQAENQRRWTQEGPQSSPLMDWNQDGNVDIAEFGNAVHSLFVMVDKDKDDQVTVAELQAPRLAAPPRPAITPTTSSSTPPPGGGYP